MLKDEILPEIPVQQTPSTHSMYEQLRKTSQKWFQKSQHRIFDNSSHQRSQHSVNFNHTSQLSPRMAAPSQSRLMEVMRQQIDIACQQYSLRCKNMLIEQSKKIKVLGELLNKNQIELEGKNREIERLQGMLRNARNSGSQKQMKMMRERVEIVEQRLTEIQEFMKESNDSHKWKQIQRGLKTSLGTISQHYHTRLDEIHFDLQDRIDRMDKMTHLNQTMNNSIRSSRPTTADNIPQCQVKLASIQHELEQLKEQVESFHNKKYNYENYKLEHLENKIRHIHQIVTRLEMKKEHSRQDHSQIKLKSSQTTQLTSTAHLPHDSKTNFFNRYKSLINNRKMREEIYSSQEQSQTESEVQATLVEDQQDQESTVDRFIRVVTETRMKLPVHIQVDSTGYVRSVQTGMYLVDSTSNGFELTPSELTHLSHLNIIKH